MRSASPLIDLSVDRGVPCTLKSFVVADCACTVVILCVGAGLLVGLVDLRLLDFGSLVLDFGFLGQGSLL